MSPKETNTLSILSLASLFFVSVLGQYYSTTSTQAPYSTGAEVGMAIGGIVFIGCMVYLAKRFCCNRSHDEAREAGQDGCCLAAGAL